MHIVYWKQVSTPHVYITDTYIHITSFIMRGNGEGALIVTQSQLPQPPNYAANDAGAQLDTNIVHNERLRAYQKFWIRACSMQTTKNDYADTC